MHAFFGHTIIQKQLEHLLHLSEVPQSFLFAGPRHVGKSQVAHWFATCLIDADIPQNVPSNLMVIEPEEIVSSKQVREKLISIETIRTAQQFLTLSPMGGKRRVVIIHDAEKLGAGASNALLKILEEPPEQSVVILLTAEPGRLLPTLVSRLLPFFFRPLESELLEKAWPALATLPHFFLDLGLPGVLYEALNHQDRFDEKKNWLRQLFQISKLSLHDRLSLAENLAKNQTLTRDVLEIWCVGLVFQLRHKEGQLTPHYLFLENILKTLGQLSRGEGTSRLLLEKLLVAVS